MIENMRRFISVLVSAFFLLATISCLPRSVSRPWGIADLRRLGALDAPTPATDIIAVYTRTSDLTVDVRVDLLDINPGDKYLIRFSLRDNRNFYTDPLLIDFSSNGGVHTTGIGAGKPVIWPRVFQDFGMDTITLSLNRAFIGERYQLDVSAYTTDPIILVDEALDVRSDGQPPVNRAPVLVAFWDTFPAVTPAQALRRWDGAHTGPLGDRHGLKHILDGAGQYHVPVALLDIKNPASLAVLNYMGITAQIQNLAEHALLILPDVAYAEPAEISLNFSRRAAIGFGLPVSEFVYNASSRPQSNYQAQFYLLPDSSHMAHSGGKRFIPLPSADAVEATEDGPSLDVRRALVEAANSPDPADLVVLGGSLPHSTWGDADMASPTFEWLSAHPWVQTLNSDELMTFPERELYVPPLSPVPEHPPFLDALRSAPDNIISESAWQLYLTLTAPTTDTQLQALRAAYLGQVTELLAAARWAENPSVHVGCADDLDVDGQNECILSNQEYFAILDINGARLTNLFYLDTNSAHQLVGPSSQFAVGLSDPSEWHPDGGDLADPSVIPGAFADSTDTLTNYNAVVISDGVRFTSPDGSRIKTYRLTDKGIDVAYQVPGSVTTHIPLVVDSQSFYFGPTDYRPALALRSWTWSRANGIGVDVRTDASLSADGFVASYPFFFMPEDPNLDYPKGHYVPFPLSIVTIQGQQSFSVHIAVK